MEQESRRMKSSDTRILADYIAGALRESKVKSLADLTEETLQKLKPDLMKDIQGTLFQSKYGVLYRIHDIYFSDKELRIYSLMPNYSSRLFPTRGRMALSMHLNDKEISDLT